MAKTFNRQQTETQINMRVWKDPAFKKKLNEKPHDALKTLGMSKVPSRLNVRVVEEEKNQWIIRLYNRPGNFKSMSDAELKRVAGGEAQEAKCCPKSPKS
jgi:hypothetical protein